MSKQSQYEAAIRDLMANDSNASWNEILGECDGDYTDAMLVLVRDLGETMKHSPDADFYKQILESLIL